MTNPLSIEREHQIRIYEPTHLIASVLDGERDLLGASREFGDIILDLLREVERLRSTSQSS